MKKCAFLLCFLALITSATAAVNFSTTDEGWGRLAIRYTTTVPGEVPRSVSLRVQLSNGATLYSAGNSVILEPTFRVFMDYVYYTELNNPGTYWLSNGHPVAWPLEAGAMQLPNDSKILPSGDFSLSMATLYYEGENMAAPEGTDIPLIIMQLADPTDAGSTVATVTLDERRNGVMNSNGPIATNLDNGASIQQAIDFTNAPAICWNNTQCYGDSDNDGDTDTVDWPIFRNSFGKTYPNILYNPCADYNRDGTVNTVDFSYFRDWFAISSVPTNCPIGGVWPPM